MRICAFVSPITLDDALTYFNDLQNTQMKKSSEVLFSDEAIRQYPQRILLPEDPAYLFESFETCWNILCSSETLLNQADPSRKLNQTILNESNLFQNKEEQEGVKQNEFKLERDKEFECETIDLGQVQMTISLPSQSTRINSAVKKRLSKMKLPENLLLLQKDIRIELRLQQHRIRTANQFRICSERVAQLIENEQTSNQEKKENDEITCHINEGVNNISKLRFDKNEDVNEAKGFNQLKDQMEFQADQLDHMNEQCQPYIRSRLMICDNIFCSYRHEPFKLLKLLHEDIHHKENERQKNELILKKHLLNSNIKAHHHDREEDIKDEDKIIKYQSSKQHCLFEQILNHNTNHQGFNFAIQPRCIIPWSISTIHPVLVRCCSCPMIFCNECFKIHSQKHETENTFHSLIVPCDVCKYRTACFICRSCELGDIEQGQQIVKNYEKDTNLYKPRIPNANEEELLDSFNRNIVDSGKRQCVLLCQVCEQVLHSVKTCLFTHKVEILPLVRADTSHASF
ncbi:MAG: hypothetical protein EZS28_024025 [Streblomastix strix]|uniref:Uncharacterized protein n=1 Tax=Streblomastix strix TaxID=222440 RepID=A0A5J4VD28_9EUKA|nr:MAG: hypothetical protein EZS28_024025 [Streblomastix strix]